MSGRPVVRRMPLGPAPKPSRRLILALALVWLCAAVATVAAAPAIPARRDHTMIYDPVRDRLIVFGGRDATVPLNDVWELPLSGPPVWNQLAPSGPPPAARFRHVAFYDPVRDRMIVFAGQTDVVGFNDVWELSLGASPAWSPMITAGTPPSPYAGGALFYQSQGTPTAVYDSRRHRMVAYKYPQVYELTLGDSPTWNPVATQGPPLTLTSFRAIYDPNYDMMQFVATFHLTDKVVASLDLSTNGWFVSPTIAAYREDAEFSVVYDPVGLRGLAFGGVIHSFYPLSSYDRLTDQTFAFTSTSWNDLGIITVKPSPRRGHAAACDPVRKRMIVFGGNPSVFDSTGLLNDTWALSLFGAPVWSEIVDAPTPVLLASFEARTGAAGLEVRWRFGAGARFTGVGLERSERAEGPWIHAGAAIAAEGDGFVAVDRGAIPGRTYSYRLVVRDGEGRSQVFGPISAEFAGPMGLQLSAVVPNPATERTSFELTVPCSMRARVGVFDVHGREVASLLDATLPAGRHPLSWEGRTSLGAAPAGLYLLRADTEAGSVTRRFAILH